MITPKSSVASSMSTPGTLSNTPVSASPVMERLVPQTQVISGGNKAIPKKLDLDSLQEIHKIEMDRKTVIEKFAHAATVHLQDLACLLDLYQRAIIVKKILSSEVTETMFAGAILHKMLETVGNSLKQLAIRLSGKSGQNIIIADVVDDFVSPICNLLCLFSVNHVSRMELLTESKKKNNELQLLLEKIQENPKISTKSLEQLFQSIVDRLDIYGPLISNLVQITPKNSQDYNSLQESVQVISQAQDYISATKTKPFQFIIISIISKPAILLYEADIYKRIVQKSELIKIQPSDKLKIIILSDAIVLANFDTEIRRRVFPYSDTCPSISDAGIVETAIKFANTILYTVTRIERDMLLFHYNKLMSLLS